MKKQRATWVKIALAIFFVSAAAQAGDLPIIGADLAVKSKYIWRGMPFNDEAVFWPDAWLYWSNLTVTIFGSMEMTDIYGNQNKFTEVDCYFDYSRTLGNVGLSFGYAHYTYPNTDYLTTGEFYGKVTGDAQFIQASLSAYWDVKEAEGFYITPSISRSFSTPYVQPSLSLSVGYANKNHNIYYFGIDKSGFTDLTTTLSLSYAPPTSLGKYLAISGDLNYAVILDSELADAYPNAESNFWWGIGINLFYDLGGAE